MDEILTPKEVCNLLKISMTTLWRWTNLEEFPFIKIGPPGRKRSPVRFKRKSIERWLERREETRG